MTTLGHATHSVRTPPSTVERSTPLHPAPAPRTNPVWLLATVWVVLFCVVLFGAAIAVAVLIVSLGWLGALKRGVAHPMAFFATYLSFVFIVPPVAMWTGVVSYGPLFGGDPANETYVLALVLGFLGSAVGIRVGSGVAWRRVVRRDLSGDLWNITGGEARLIRDAGRIVLGLMLVYRLVFLWRYGVFSHSVVSGSELSARQSAEATISIAAAACAVLITMGNLLRSKGRTALAGVDIGLVVTIVLVSLAIGSRAELLPLLIVPLVVAPGFSGRSGLLRIAVAGALVFLTFSVVEVVRNGGQLSSVIDASVIETATVPVKSPTLILIDGMNATDAVGLAHGSTYAESIPFLIPSPISNPLLGAPQGSGARALVDALDYRGRSGLGYSFPLEWYVNFGIVGVPIGGLVFGYAAGRIYRAFVTGRTFIGVIVWPILLARLPIMARADFLAAVNGLLYAVLLCLTLAVVARSGGSKFLRRSGE